MTDQSKRWTAIDRGIYRGKDLVACGNKVWGKLSDDCATASRLAACADLLRGHGDLDEVVVMTGGEADRVRRALESALLLVSTALAGYQSAEVLAVRSAITVLPVPAKEWKRAYGPDPFIGKDAGKFA